MVIELGEARDAPVVDRPPWIPRRRRGIAEVVAVAALLASLGAAAPVRGALADVTIPATASDGMAVEGDSLYLTTPNAAVVGPGERTIAMYRLPGARLVWRVSLAVDGPVRGPSLVDGTLLGTVEGESTQTIAVRTDTGRVRWRHAGWWQRGGPGQVLLWDQRQGDTVQRFKGVALDTGAVRWSLSIPAAETAMADHGRLVRWSASGRVAVYDTATGAVLASADLPTADPEPQVFIAGGLLLVGGRTGERPVVTAYGLDRLDRRWQADIDLRREYVAGECGDALCVGRDTGGVRLVEYATGRTRWTVPEFGYLQAVGPYLIAAGRGEPARLAVLDPATGREVGDLGHWQTSLSVGDGHMLGVRAEPRAARTWIAWLDPAALSTRVLGVANGVFDCRAGASAVVCRRSGGAVGVWYLRRRLDS